uniref:Glutathione S-transferase n=1 Tax=Eptatretus burgeri TaxID=7764 RepID=A0A8C4QQ21_EPTBU
MSNFKITYFPCRGRCTAIKMLLSDQGMTWEEDTISSLSEWESSETKKESAFGQLPGFTDGDFTMYQSNAILRYLARKFDLYGSNDKEAACIDMLNDGVEDLRMKYLNMIYTNYEEGKADFVKSLSVQLNHFEKLLFKNQEGKVCLVGSKVSYFIFLICSTVPLLHLTVFPSRRCNSVHLTACSQTPLTILTSLCH